VAEAKFEKDLERLEKVVEELEEGGLPLDDALKKFEEGVKLSKRCEQALNAAERKIEMLTKNARGELAIQQFGDDVAESEAGERSGAREAESDSADDDEDDETDEDGLLF
jgi:exodeoxyribonuclease VII small subunit